MKMNKEFILKNLMGIICAVIILALFLPFMSVKTERFLSEDSAAEAPISR